VSVAGILLLSFVGGSVPFSNIAARSVSGVDLRDFGGGAKGAVGPLIAGDRTVVAAIAGGLAVAGHNWSPFLRGAGGRGVAPALGALLVTAWPGSVLLLVGLLAGKFFRNTGMGGFVAEVALTPVLAVWGGEVAALAGACIAVPMLVKRVLGNSRPVGERRRVYVYRLLYDRDPAPGAP
jgi:glycerol-3-phosphate acyltransferase PlsY